MSLSETIHLIHGKEDDYHGIKTKTGCGKEARDIRSSVYWKNRIHVTCPVCLQKIDRQEKLMRIK